VIFAVAVFFAVGLVMLFVVRDQIVKRKTVMGGNEVHTGIRAAARSLVQIGAAGDAEGELTQRLILAAPIIAHAVAVLAVPFQP
jgi:hypothetical protein